MNTYNKPVLNASNLYIFAKFFFYGMILGEVWVISDIIATAVYSKLLATAPAPYLWISIFVYLVVALVYIESQRRAITIVFKSYRVDLLATIAAGFFFVYSGGGFKIEYINNLLSALSEGQAAIIAFIPIVLIFSWDIAKSDHEKNTSQEVDTNKLFITDKPINSDEDDLLGIRERAESFAKKVSLENSDNHVFALDAPWGAGKTSFLNLCMRYWQNKDNQNNSSAELIIYSFDILAYEQHTDLPSKFTDGLIKEIEKHIFDPEISMLVNRYKNLVKDCNIAFPASDFRFNLSAFDDDINSVIKSIDSKISKSGKRLIVIVDDLDRLELGKIKNILTIMHKAFSMNNVNYILCYDTQNIINMHNNITREERESAISFLEKFVHIKMNLYIGQAELTRYLSRQNVPINEMEFLADPTGISGINLGLLKNINDSEFHLYTYFIGNARQIKRIMNASLLLDIYNLKFNINDFDEQDLVNLLIIYINYPHIFKKICDTELCNTTNYKSFFAVDYQDNKHISSIAYMDYTEALPKTQKFILDKIFAKDKVVGKTDVGELEIATFACFNNYNNYNLKKYLKLILDVQKPENQSYKKYIILRNEILQKENAEQVFTRPDVSSEAAQQLLWRAIVNTPATEFSVEKAKDVIDYAVRSLGNYDYINTSGGSYGFRTTMAHYLVMLLNKIGWNDQNSRFFDSSNQDNVIKIADRIFGNGQPSIINELCNIDKGVMGLNDLLSFRLACCVDRSGDIFNLSRALVLNSEKKETNGMDMGTQLVIGMRPLSQATYSVFSELFKSKNLFDEIDKLELENVISTRFGKQETLENAEYALEKAKCELKGFIVYQLGNKVISSGIGCGFYDLDGREDKHGINKDFNNYLFDVCFNPDLNRDNYYHFLDYMFMNFSRNLTAFGNTNKHSLNISNIKNVLDKELLKKYWQENISNLKNIAESSQDNFVVINDFKLEYSKHFDLLSDGLNKWFSESVKKPL